MKNELEIISQRLYEIAFKIRQKMDELWWFDKGEIPVVRTITIKRQGKNVTFELTKVKYPVDQAIKSVADVLKELKDVDVSVMMRGLVYIGKILNDIYNFVCALVEAKKLVSEITPIISAIAPYKKFVPQFVSQINALLIEIKHSLMGGASTWKVRKEEIVRTLNHLKQLAPKVLEEAKAKAKAKVIPAKKIAIEEKESITE